MRCDDTRLGVDPDKTGVMTSPMCSVLRRNASLGSSIGDHSEEAALVSEKLNVSLPRRCPSVLCTCEVRRCAPVRGDEWADVNGGGDVS